MKLFLRYQLSGTVLVSWWLLFLYYADKSKFCEIQEFILSKNILGVVFGALALYPLGAFVHQVSVLLKNYLIGRYFFESFNDFPHVEVKVVLNNGKRKLDFDRCKFLFEKLSDLNSFFYVRYDMGFVAPLMAFLGTIIFVEVPSFDLVWVVILLVWSAGLLIYMGRLAQERVSSGCFNEKVCK